MSVMAVESGTGDGYVARVTASGRLFADVEELQRVVEPVTTLPATMSVATSTPTATNAGSAQVANARSGRRWLEIQNLGDFPVHLLLEGSPAMATAQHRRIDPGQVFNWDNGVAYEGAVQAIAVGGNSPLVIMEFYTT